MKILSVVKKAIPCQLRLKVRNILYLLGIIKSISVSENVEAKDLMSVSQAGQDFWVYSEVFNEMRGGYFVDIGAHDGLTFSNSYLLEKRYGWSGMCVEANPQTFKLLKLNRTVSCINVCLDSEQRKVKFMPDGVFGGIMAEDCDNKGISADASIEMTTRTLVDILDEDNAPIIIHYLSIDVEGAEDRVLLDFPFDRYKFMCITIERPSAMLSAKLETAGYILVKNIPGLDIFYSS